MRKGFTLLELIFVIVVLGILARFGTELLYKVYENYVYSNTFNRLENQSEMAVKQIANRLQYRIKDSTIARSGIGTSAIPIGGIVSGSLESATVLEWIGIDIDGWRGTGRPEWSGFIDLSDSTQTELSSPGTSKTSGNGAIFFIGSDVALDADFGWNGVPIATQAKSIHPIQFAANSKVLPDGGDFSQALGGVYEFYQFAETAYAVSLEADKLYFYHTYQPWKGETAVDGSKELLMENVKTFGFTALGDMLIVQVCVSDNNATGIGEYSICKEKVVF